jgi:DNA invertase Pin-like site-specific DNA recombinase
MAFRACILNSVSGPAQATAEKFSLEEQDRDNHLSCQAHNWTVVEVITIIHSRDYLWLHEILRDCPPFAHLVSLIESGAIDLIVVRHYDRLWSNSSLQGQISALCRQHKVQIFAILQPKEPVDPSLLPRRPGLQGIMESLSGVLRDEEQNIRVARRAVGMEKRIIKGEHVWGPTPAYGFTRQDKALVVDESEWRWLEEMKRWVLDEGLGACGIEARLNRLGVPPPGAVRRATPTRDGRWTRKTIKRILTNPLYAGVTRWGAFSNNGQHRTLFTPEEQARVVAALSGHSARQGKYPDRLLSGLARCGYCGHAMSYCMSFGVRYLRCSWHTNSRGRECRNNGNRASQVHAYLLDAIYHATLDRDDWLAARRAQHDSAQIQERIAAIDAQIAEHQGRFGQWSHAYEVGVIGLNELAEHRQRILSGVEALRGERQGCLVRLESEAQALAAMEEMASDMENLVERAMEQQRLILVRLIERVEFRQGSPPSIYWR